MQDKPRKILFGLIMAILLLPLVQLYVPVIKSAALNGAFHPAPDVELTAARWLDGSYQQGKAQYLNDNICFRPDLIRVNEQIDYSLFNKTSIGWALAGKNGCLFDMQYIHAWNGADYIGDAAICTQLRKLKALQDTLSRLGKTLLLVHTASKAFFYPECIPGYLKPTRQVSTNFSSYIRIGDSLGINQCNINAWFRAMKDTSRELLYTKQGIHWSIYGAGLAGDSMVRSIERQRHIHMPHPQWTNLRHTHEPMGSDDDISRTMNLIWPCAVETFTYGTLACNNDTAKARPSTVYIGDSFTVTLIEEGYFDCVNSSWEFWFYFKTLHKSEDHNKGVPMDHYNWQAAIDSTDCVVLMYNAANLNNLGSGFIDAAYAHYFPAL